MLKYNTMKTFFFKRKYRVGGSVNQLMINKRPYNYKKLCCFNIMKKYLLQITAFATVFNDNYLFKGGHQ